MWLANSPKGSPEDFAGEEGKIGERLTTLSAYDFIVLGGGKATSNLERGLIAKPASDVCYMLWDWMAGRCSIVANALEVSHHFRNGSSLQGQTLGSQFVVC